jgi:hypothetical protein
MVTEAIEEMYIWTDEVKMTWKGSDESVKSSKEQGALVGGRSNAFSSPADRGHMFCPSWFLDAFGCRDVMTSS